MKHSVQIMSGVYIGTGVQLIAPVLVGAGAYIAGGSVITADVPAGALAIARGRQTNVEGWVQRKRGELTTPPTSESSQAKRSRYYRRRLEDFKELVAANSREEDYQIFLEKDYWILGANYEECSAKVRAGAAYVPDFMLERTDGLFEVVELKTPGAVLFARSRNRLVESAVLREAVAQLLDYLQYYNRHYLSESQIHGKDLRIAAGKVVIGRTVGPEERDRIRQLNERYVGIAICTYDDLIAAATSLVKLVEREEAI